MKVSKKQLPPFARDFLDARGYRGRRIYVEVRASVTIPSDAGLWSGGTRDQFFAMTNDGAVAPSATNAAAPWAACGRGATIDLPAHVCVARHSFFCGDDMGWTFFVAPGSQVEADRQVYAYCGVSR